jgi:hypothetical protein
MPRRRLVLCLLLCALGLPAPAQETTPAPAPAAAPPAEAAPQQAAPADSSSATPATEPDAAKPKDDWRDTSSYRFPALASTVAAAQNMVYAMSLREYCADAKVPGEFVRERLARFSRITGRAETCQSLMDY